VAVVALLPGSRQEEVRHLAGLFIDAAVALHRNRPGLAFILPAATPVIHQQIRALLAARRLPDRFPLTLVSGQSHRAMEAADAVLVASGTATLEAALIGRAMVIAYRMGALNYRLMRNRGYLPWIGLPNILANETLVPEFIQDAATPDRLARALLEWLDDAAGRERLRARFRILGDTLRRNCAERSAAAILELARR
jgi:lipid-A-disaccharide synthase